MSLAWCLRPRRVRNFSEQQQRNSLTPSPRTSSPRVNRKMAVKSPKKGPDVKWHQISASRQKDLEQHGGWNEVTWNAAYEKAHQQAHEFEFGGPINVIFMMLGLPIGIWGLFLACNPKSDGCLPPLVIPDPSQYTFYSHEAMAVLLAWVGWLVLLWAVVPGRELVARRPR